MLSPKRKPGTSLRRREKHNIVILVKHGDSPVCQWSMKYTYRKTNTLIPMGNESLIYVHVGGNPGK